MNSNEKKMPRLVAELHAQFSPLLSHWERPGEGACISAKRLRSPWERLGEGCWPQASIAIKANLRGLGYGG